jgi:hypothetical protein
VPVTTAQTSGYETGPLWPGEKNLDLDYALLAPLNNIYLYEKHFGVLVTSCIAIHKQEKILDWI